ncbi:MAG: class I SAM-dependent methyltransferase [Sedimentisphaerales bacterium]|nr:class I SAM-dependent methyltransferase [Sedimentisphaerales bacterium]
MVRKGVIGLLIVSVISGFVLAQQTGSRRGAADRAAQGRMGGGMMDDWLDQLDKAYQANNREEMGKLIEQFKQMRQQRGGMGPGGIGPGMGPGMGQGMQPPQGGRGLGGASPENAPVPQDDIEKKILAVLDDMRQNQSRGMMNCSVEDGRFFRILVESMNAKTVVEIGTSNGYSGIWWCLGLRKTGGRLITHDIDKNRFDLATANFKRAGVSELVQQVFGDAHETVAKIEGPIDILFLDADKEGYMDYLEKLLPKVRPGGLILAHNTTNAGRSMQNYLTAITTNKDLETIFVHKDQQGVSVTLKKR